MKKTCLHSVNLDTLGGVEQLLYHLVTSDTSIDHHIFSPGQKIHKNFRPQLKKSASSITYEKYLFGMKMPPFIRKIVKNRVFTKGYDAIVLWNRLDPITQKVPYIYYEHGASWVAKEDEKILPFFDNVTKIVAISNAAKRLLECKWGVKKPITVIPNPLRPDITISLPRKRPKTPLVLGCIGRLLPLKGFCIAIEAVRRLLKQNYPVKLFIAGTGPERERLETAAQGLPVTFIGSEENPTYFYDLIDILLVPSIREPFGLVALEAAARGVPVIASSVDGLPEVCAMESIPQTLPIEALLDFGGTTEKMPDHVYDPILDSIRPPKCINPDDLAAKIVAMNLEDTYRKKSIEAISSVERAAHFELYKEKLLSFFLGTI